LGHAENIAKVVGLRRRQINVPDVGAGDEYSAHEE
jgi:hypothetical protein